MTEFVVPGPPVSKQRPRRSPSGNWYTPKKTVDYENLVAQCAIAAGLKLEPKKWYSLSIDFYLSSFRKDRDNQVKCVMDGLQRVGDNWNDNQIADLYIRTIGVKDGSEEKAVVKVETMSQVMQRDE